MYGLLGSVPAKMLHVSGTGLLKCMFSCLDSLIGGTELIKKDKKSFVDLHHCLVRDAEKQSERHPCMSIRNGIIDGTKICGSERAGMSLTPLVCHETFFLVVI